MKPWRSKTAEQCPDPAAFGRLRVETLTYQILQTLFNPAAFGRLRVETKWFYALPVILLPAAFGRLRVETRLKPSGWKQK